jgi:hypothetical protein
MKKLFLFSLPFIFLCSCKKEYKCHCTSQERRGFVSHMDYNYKEKKKETAYAKCVQQYEESGLAGSNANCEIL